jgi:hypothetical protein
MIFMRQGQPNSTVLNSLRNSSTRTRLNPTGSIRSLNANNSNQNIGSNLSRPSINLINLHSSNTHTANSNANSPPQNLASTSNQPLIRSAISNNSIDYARSSSINEKLASIGGVFGIISIIVTAVLLYAIFTSQSEDKWFYIIAVLINISLLVLLMIGAILFDRFYLKKYALNESQQANLTRPSVCENREQSRPRLQRNQRIARVSQTRTANTSPSHFTSNGDVSVTNNQNDLPPVYPGPLSDTNSKSTAGVSNLNSRQTSNSNVNINRVKAFDERERLLEETSSVLFVETPTDTDNSNLSSSNHPPNYFDLYPS